MEREDLLRQLEENLQRARARREHAAAVFDQALTPSVYDPNRASKLKAASQEYSQALEGVNKALKAYNEAILKARKPANATGDAIGSEGTKTG